MGLKAHEREVIYADVIVRRRAEQAPFPPLSALADLWKKANDKSWKPKTFENGTVTAIIAGFRDDPIAETITLLISVADPNASDSTYADHSKRESRTIAKAATEGNEHSAHVVIATKERKGLPNTYGCLIERVPTLSVARVQSILNEVIGRACKANDQIFTFKGAGGQKKAKPFQPNVVISLISSDEFANDVETGVINGLKLSRPASSETGTAIGPYLTAQDYSLSVKVSKDIPPGDRWKTIKAGLKAKSAEFGKARLYLKPVDASSSTSVEIDTATGALLGEAYAKKRRIGPLNPLLRNGAEEIVPHLEAEMQKLLEADA